MTEAANSSLRASSGDIPSYGTHMMSRLRTTRPVVKVPSWSEVAMLYRMPGLPNMDLPSRTRRLSSRMRSTEEGELAAASRMNSRSRGD